MYKIILLVTKKTQNGHSQCPCLDTPGIAMPDESVSKQTRAKWLLEVCEEHVRKCVFNKDDLSSLVQRTMELEVVN